jgi:hypothetical protein
MSVPTTPRPLTITRDLCRCCRDLPPELGCWPSGVASCDLCGWFQRYTDVYAAPEWCPACGGFDPDDEPMVVLARWACVQEAA